MGGGNMFGGYGQFMNDPTAQVAAQFGQTAFKHGQEIVEQNVCYPDLLLLFRMSCVCIGGCC
jgi:hypothetical protein